MGRRVLARLPRRVADGEHGAERRLEVARAHTQRAPVVAFVADERAGEAVRLLLEVHGLVLVVPRAFLDRVAPLVREHERRRERAERIGELRHEASVVVGDEVAVQAVERVALHIRVDGALSLAGRDRDAGSRGDDASPRERLVARVVQPRELVGPVGLEVGDRGGDHLLVRRRRQRRSSRTRECHELRCEQCRREDRNGAAPDPPLHHARTLAMTSSA